MNGSRAIGLDTPDFIVRTIEPSDDLARWPEWLADTDAARNLNARAGRLSEETLRQYVASFDGETSYLFGIFEKRSGSLVGIRAVYVDPEHKEFLVNVIVGEARGSGARTQSRDVVYRYFFEEIGLEAARASVVSTNEPVLAGMAKRGWLHEHTSLREDANGNGHIELLHFRLSREKWRRRQHA